MALSLLGNIRTKDSDRLFYDQYHWCVSFVIPGLSCLRYHHEERKRYHENIRTAWNYRFNSHRFLPGTLTKNLGGSWRLPECPDRLEDVLENLWLFADFLEPHRGNIKLVIAQDQGYIYTNEENFLHVMDRCTLVSSLQYCRARIVRQRGVVVLRDPQYQYRTYLRERRVTQDQYENLTKFLQNRTDIKMSGALSSWLERKSHYRGCRNYYFFDHDDAGLPFMMEIVCPGLIKDTQPITKVNN